MGREPIGPSAAEAALAAALVPGGKILVLGVAAAAHRVAGDPPAAAAWGVSRDAVLVLARDGSVAQWPADRVSEVRCGHLEGGESYLVLEADGVPVSRIDAPVHEGRGGAAFLLGRAVLRMARGERSRLVDPIHDWRWATEAPARAA